MGWLFLPIYLSSGIFTLPAYIQRRFGGRRILIYLSGLSLVLYILTKMSVALFSGSLFIKMALQWDMPAAIALLIALTAFCTIGGGLTAVIYTDTIQALIMCFGGIALMILAFIEVGGIENLFVRYMEAIPALIPENSTCAYPSQSSLYIMKGPLNNEMPWPGFFFGMIPVAVWYWATDQVIVQRALAAKNLAHAQGGTLLAGYIKILPLFVMVMPGMISRVLYPDEIACAVPEECEKVCGNRSGCTNLAYPMLVMRLMPSGMRGLMVAVMLAALVSDLTSIFNSSSSIFTMDIYPLFRKDPSNREQMIVGRLFVLLMTVISVLWIPVVQNTQGGQLFMYIQAIQAYLTPPVAAVYFTAVFWPRATEQGAFWSLILGIAPGVVRMALEFTYPEPACGEVDIRPGVLKNMNYMYYAFYLFGQTVILIVIISLLTPEPEKWRTIRATVWQSKDRTVRPDEMESSVIKEIIQQQNQQQQKQQGKNEKKTFKCMDHLDVPSNRDPLWNEKSFGNKFWSYVKWSMSWFCGFALESTPDGKKETDQTCTVDNDEFKKSVQDYVNNLVDSVQQNPKVKFFMCLNLLIILACIIFLNILFAEP